MGMIDAKQAKDLLGCDDATLQQHVNSGAIKAQRQGGKLLVDGDDVQRLAKKEDEEGTIVLTGESDNLQIDLGKVVDDSSETIVSPKATSGKDTQSITFGEELEVVSLEDSRTQDIGTKPTTAAQGLSFTDSNTAVMTSVEETSVGATTDPVETGPQQAGPGNQLPTGESGRRSVRSSRRMQESEVDVPWYWMAFMALAFVVGMFFIVPFYVIGVTPKLNERDRAGDISRGANDTVWAGMAGSIAGFAVEPDKDKWLKAGNTGEYRDIKDKDPQAQWRYQAYLGDLKGPGERLQSFRIEKISEDGKTATSKVGNRTYPLEETKVKSGDNAPEIPVLRANVWPEK